MATAVDKKSAREQALKSAKKTLNVDIKSAKDTDDIKVDVIPSGSLGIDILTGIGGYPRGRIVEIYGPNASGKTTLTLHAIAECQKLGGFCAFIDAEHTFVKEYAEAIGVNLENLDVFRPDSGEQALQVVEHLTRSEGYDLVVIDSVAALVPAKEISGEMGDSHVGLQARLMGQALRKLVGVVSKTNTTIIFLNQLRSKIGVMFGNPETTSGGNSLGFYASLRLDVRKIKQLKQGDLIIGGRTRVKMVKNKLKVPTTQIIEFDMYSNNEFGAGISYVGEVFEAAVNLKLVDQSGAWYTVAGERVHGKDNCVKFLTENPEVFETLNKQVRKEYRLVEED